LPFVEGDNGLVTAGLGHYCPVDPTLADHDPMGQLETGGHGNAGVSFYDIA